MMDEETLRSSSGASDENAPAADACGEQEPSEAAEDTAVLDESMTVEGESEDAETEPEAAEEEPDFAEESEEAPVPKKKVDFRKIAKVVADFLPVLLFALSVIYVGYYIIFPSRGEFHSDCTDTIYWANASYESGHVFNENFGYACLLPFGGSLLMQIFMPFFGLSMTTHILGMLLFFILFITFFCLMLREMHWDHRYICGAGAILLMMLCASQKMREIFWGHTIYYSLGVLFIFIGLFLLFRLRNLGEKRQAARSRSLNIRYFVTLGIFLIFFLLTCTNRISSLTIFGLPMMAGIFAEALLDSKTPLLSRRNGKTLVLLIMMSVMMVLGLKLCNLWAGDIVAGYETAYSNFSDTSEWLGHVQGLPLAWLLLLGLENLPGTNLMSGDSIKNLIHMFAAIIIVVLPIAATICYPKYEGEKGRQMHVCIWVHWAVTALILVGWICGSLSAANWRLTPVICTSIVVSLLFVHWAISEKTTLARLSIILMIPVIAASVLNAWEVVHMPHDNYKDSDLYQLVDYLEESDLDYGYATFWNANAMTIISDDTIKVRNVNINEMGVDKNTYQSDSTWYDAQEGQPDYFLLLSQGENDTLVNGGAEILSRAVQTKQVETTNGGIFYIYVFNENIF